jgi:HK97 gp10 family phage protein
MVAVTVKLTGVDGVIETLKALPPEIVSKRGGPVKAALRAGARVILREAALNLAHATENLTADGQESTGLLLKSLIASRGKPPAGVNGERYLVRFKRRVYQREGKPVTTLQTARFLEYGTSQQPAEPFLRPAFNAKAAQAISVTTAELTKAIDRVVKKLAAQNRGK